MHSHGLTAAAGDHGGMLLPGADPVADILDDLAPGTTRQACGHQQLHYQGGYAGAKTTEASPNTHALNTHASGF